MRIAKPSFPPFVKKFLKLFTIMGGLLLLGLGIAAGSIFLITTKPELVGLSKKSDNQEQVKKLLNEIGTLISLPEDEEPTVATVSDAEKLREQAFFQKAENGDQVLIYSKTRKVILYRPSQKKIIDVGSINIKNQTSDANETDITNTNADTKTFSVAIYNGTQTTGITNIYDDRVLRLFPSAKVALKQNAARTDYPTSYIVDIKGDQSQLIQQLSSELKLPIQTLPEGEAKPAADVLIVLGEDATN